MADDKFSVTIIEGDSKHRFLLKSQLHAAAGIKALASLRSTEEAFLKISRHVLIVITQLLLILVFTTHSIAQETISYLKMNPDDLKMMRCPTDTAASAMILNDIGSTKFEYDPENGFFMLFERLVRIKIFKKEGYSYADWSIPLYQNPNNKEKIQLFKAKTYNLENDKVVEVKVKDESVFWEEEDSYKRNYRFTFPAVKEGSVIELKYIIKSEFFRYLRDWTFQKSIPVRWSEYKVMIPEFYQYNTQFYGTVPFFINKASTSSSSITDRQGNYSSLYYDDNVLHLAARDVPAIVEEPYVNSIENYTSKAKFTLRSYKFPHQEMVPVNTTWAQVGADMLKDDDFGIQLKKGGATDDLAAVINTATQAPFEKMLMGFDRIRNSLKWNGNYSKYTSNKLTKTWVDKTGNSADINLLLITLMRELGLTANPVLLSTRDHGILSEYSTSLAAMNHVICSVTIDNKEYLLDATQRWLPYNMLPFQCLNGIGLVVMPENVRWVDLLTNEKNNVFYQANLKIDTTGEISGTMQFSALGYPARNIRAACSGAGKEEYIGNLKKNLKSWEVEDIMFENLDSLNKPLLTGYKIKSTDISQVAGNLIYMNILANLNQFDYSFPQEKRFLPIDFGCPFKESYIFTFEIAGGYTVESYPQNVRLALPDQGGSYKLMTTVEGGKIIVNVQISITKANFYVGEYLPLREFFAQVIAKQSQQIVFKKI
jgi:hypothetical protein